MTHKQILITPDFIRKFGPCYDPSKYLAEDYSADIITFLRHDKIPAKDKLWMVLREECIDAKTLRLFAVWCARTALALVDSPDPRSVAACDVAEKYANGEATLEELSAAWDAQIEQLISMLEAQS